MYHTEYIVSKFTYSDLIDGYLTDTDTDVLHTDSECNLTEICTKILRHVS